MIMHFLCAYDKLPVPLTDGTLGFVIEQPKEWVAKFAPAIAKTVTLLKVAGKVASVFPMLPGGLAHLGSHVEGISQYLGMLPDAGRSRAYPAPHGW